MKTLNTATILFLFSILPMLAPTASGQDSFVPRANAGEGDPVSRPIPTVPSPTYPATSAPPVAPTESSGTAKRELLIGDVVSFQVVEDNEPARRLIVTDSGEIDVPYIGRIKAAGSTSSAIAETIKKKLEASFYHKATVLVGLDYNAYGSRNTGRTTTGYRSGYGGYGGYGRGGAGRGDVYAPAATGFTIMGQVNRPGVYPLGETKEFKLSHAILASGGFQKFANTRKVRVIRNHGGDIEEVIEVNAHKVMTGGHLYKDLVLEKGDVIIVDKKWLNL